MLSIGDLVGPPWLAPQGESRGGDLRRAYRGELETTPARCLCQFGLHLLPSQIASIGLTESHGEGSRPRGSGVGRFPFLATGKAIALGDDEGMVKTVFDATTGALLGAHMIGAEVTELIQGFAIARTLETTEAELMNTVFPHPTLSETMHESVLDAYGRALHF